MAPRVPESFSRADVDRIVAKALKEQANTLTLEGLKLELGKVWTAIEEANHFKRDFGDKFEALNELIRGHIQLPMHPGTAEAFHERDLKSEQLLDAFGVDELTPEQRAMTPAIVQSFMDGRRQAAKRAGWHETLWGRLGIAFGGVAVVVALVSELGIFTFVRIHVFHLPS